MRLEGLPANARQPALSADELEIIVVVQHLSSAGSLWRARRSTPTAPFGEVSPYPFIDDPDADRQTPFISANGAELFFARLEGSTNADLYRVTRAADGGIGPSEPLATLNTSKMDYTPVLSPDLLSLYFYSERLASVGTGSIWVAHRDRPDGPFRAPVRVEELVFDGAFSVPGSVSADNCRLYFHSNKDDGGTGHDVYVAERLPR